MKGAVDLLVGTLLLAVWAFWALLTFWGSWAPDLSALYFAGHFQAAGMPGEIYFGGAGLFANETSDAWRDYAASVGAGGPAHIYIYPPLWAALMAPVTGLLTAQEFFDLMLPVHLAMLATSVWLSWQLAGAPGRFAAWALYGAAILGLTTPGVLAVMHNQPQITVAFLTLLAFALARSGAALGAGAVLGLAAALKVAPVIFVLIFLAGRNWRALAAFVVVGGGLGLLSLALTGWPLHATFLGRLAEIGDLIVRTRVSWTLQQLIWELTAFFGGTPLAPIPAMGTLSYPEPGWLGPLLGALSLAGIVTVLVTTRNLEPGLRIAVRLFGLTLVTGLTGPLGWSHYFLVPLLLLPVLTQLIPRGPAISLLLATLVATALPVFALLDPLNGALTVVAILPTLAMCIILAVVLRAAARGVTRRR